MTNGTASIFADLDTTLEDKVASSEKHGEKFAKAYEEAVANHGDDRVAIVESKLGPVLLRSPSRPEYKRFRSQLKPKGDNGDILEQLARQVVLYPSRQEFDAMLDRRPALADTVGNRALELAGAGEGETSKK